MLQGMEPTPRYWFPAKRYGWGWGAPRVWQGWATLAAFLAFVLAVVVLLPDSADDWATGLVLGATVPLLLVCLKKGEPTRWRWGRD
jgi:hypothetical protein